MSTIKVTNLRHESASSSNITLDSSNNAVVAGTLGCTGDLTITSGNLVVSSGNGIDFSATSGTGTSELFDDYEEGTWTPAFSGSSGSAGSAAYSSAGFYNKTGNTVTIWGYVNITNKGSWSGTLLVTGLPFTSASSAWSLGGLWITASTINSQEWFQSLVPTNDSKVIFARNYNAGADAYLEVSRVTTSTALRFTCTFRV